MTAWRVADRDGEIGVFSEKALREAMARGDLGRDCLVWREGMPAWASIEAYFPRARRRRGPLGAVLWFLAALLVTALFLAAGAFSLALVGSDLSERLPRDQLALAWMGAAAGLAVASLLFWSAWRAASADWTSMEGRGMVRILVGLLTLAGLGLAVFQGWQTEAVVRISQAAEAMRDYRFAYAAEGQTLTITGSIGPGFALALDSQLAAHPVRRVEITSPGGLLEQAMRGARSLETRNVTVVARRFCASACVVVLMGGQRRLADYDMTIDFHASAPTTDLQLELMRYVQREQTTETRTYLVRRGAPEAYVRESERLGPGKIYRAPAVILAERGMLTGLVDETGGPIPVAEARARLEADLLPGVVLKPYPMAVDAVDLNAMAARP